MSTNTEKTLALTSPIQEVAQPRIETVTGPDGRAAPVMFIPEGHGFRVQPALDLIDKYTPRPAPLRTKGMAKIESLGSFIAHVERFKREETALFIRREPPQIEAVYDYDQTAEPAYREHRASFDFKPTVAWRAWKDAHGQALSQSQFAEFLEEQGADLIDPDKLPEDSAALASVREAELSVGAKCVHPQGIRELTRGLEYHVRCARADLTNLRDGTRKVKFEEKLESKEGSELQIPGLFAIAVELFDARLPDSEGVVKASRYVLPVRLRVRPGRTNDGEGAGLVWTLLLCGVDRCVDMALSEAAERVTKDTGCPLFWGSPEV